MECDLVIVGSGPGGYVAAIKAAQMGLKTVLVEKDPYLGGTCLNVGCIPSKSLLQSSEHYYHAKHQFSAHGITFKELGVDFHQMQKRKEGVIQGFQQGINGLMKKNGVTVIHGFASFDSPHRLLIDQKQEVRFKNAIIATGSSPMPLPFLPFDEERILSSTGMLNLQEIPERLGIVGAGVIGVELGSVFSRLGSQVTVIEFLDRITYTMDQEISTAFQKILSHQGMKFELQAKVAQGHISHHEVKVTYEQNGLVKEQVFDRLLLAVGRIPHTAGLALEKAGISCDPKGWIPVGGCLQTSQPHIYAIGDVIGNPMLAHKASDQGIAVASHLAGKPIRLNMMAIPNVIYTDPEVASCGLTEQEATQMKLSYKTVKFPMKANSRAKASMLDEGFIKLIVHRDRYLIGAHLLCAHAGELIQPLIIMVDQKMPIDQYLQVPHAHPTLVEAVKEAVMAAYGKPIHF